MTTALEPARTSPQPGLAMVPGSGFMAFADMSDEQFEKSLTRAATALKRIEQVKRELMTPDVDFGIIKGTKKPTILLPGGQKLCRIAGLVATFEYTRTTGDGITAPAIMYVFASRMHVGDADGPVVGEGIGSCNSWESKYRNQASSSERVCPACGKATLRRSKWAPKNMPDGTPKGWYCADEGCKEQFAHDDPKVSEQQAPAGVASNKDAFNLDNTLAKMAKKRAFLDGTLIATMSSGLFTQDIGDDDGIAEEAARTTLLAKLKMLLKEHSINKNADLMKLTMFCLNRELTWPQVEKLPLMDVRVLHSKASEFLGEHLGEAQDGDATTATTGASEAQEVVDDADKGETPGPDATQFGAPIEKFPVQKSGE